MFLVPLILGIGAILVLVMGTPASAAYAKSMQPNMEPRRPDLHKESSKAYKPTVPKQATPTEPPSAEEPVPAKPNLSLVVQRTGQVTSMALRDEEDRQKQFNLADKDGGMKGVVDHEQIDQAIKDLNLMKAVKEPNGTGGFRMVMPASFWLGVVEKKDIVARTKALSNPALQHMFFELERKYQHAAQFARDPETKVFDSEMMRLEERNVRETLKHGGGEESFANCLVIKQYHPPKVTRQHGREITVPGKTHRKVYYYNMKGNKAPVRGSEHETMWRGDGYVTEQPKEGAEYTDIPEEQRQMGSGLNQTNRMPVQKRCSCVRSAGIHASVSFEDNRKFE